MTVLGPIVDGDVVEGSGRLAVQRKDGGGLLAEVGLAGPAELERAAAAAAAAREPMRRLPSYERTALLVRMREAVASERDDLARTLALEAGKPITAARAEVDRALHTIQTGAEEASRIGGEVLALDSAAHARGRVGLVRRFPAGPVLGITPFNFPLNLVCHKVVPAIAAGCPIVLKPASATPLSAIALGRIALAAGAPRGAVNVVPCRSDDAARLVGDDRFALLSFTGSAEVGWRLKREAGRKKVLLELGGNAAAVVHDDAELDLAATKICAGAFTYSGQSCISVQRVLVQSRIVEPFVERLLALVAKVPSGDLLDERTVVGPMIDEGSARRAAEWVESACARGARLLAGGGRRGSLLEPTVVADVPRDAPLWCEEAFAPVLAIQPYDSFADAVALVNASRFGLQAGVFTRDLGRAMEAWSELEVGGIMINDAPTWRVDPMPYGGVKESGLGREGVRYAIEEMTEPRLLVLDGNAP